MIPFLIGDFFERHRNLSEVVEARLECDEKDLLGAASRPGSEETGTQKTDEEEWREELRGEELLDLSKTRNGFRQAILLRYVAFAESMLLHISGKKHANLNKVCGKIWGIKWKAMPESILVSFLTELRNALAHGSEALVIGRIAISGSDESAKRLPIPNYAEYAKARNPKKPGKQKALENGLERRHRFCAALAERKWLQLPDWFHVEKIQKGESEEGHIDFYERKQEKPGSTGAWCDLEWIQPIRLDLLGGALTDVAEFLEKLLLDAWKLCSQKKK